MDCLSAPNASTTATAASEIRKMGLINISPLPVGMILYFASKGNRRDSGE